MALKARQVGMSQTTAIEHAHRAIFQDAYTGLIVSKNLDAALEVIRYAKVAIETGWKPDGLTITVDNKTSIELSNKSRIQAVAASKNAGRSIAATKVTIDEFAVMVWAADVFQAISPTLSTGGNLDILFSPKGRANLAYQMWTSDLGRNFSKHRIHWTMNAGFYTDAERTAGVLPEQCKWYLANRPNYTASAWAEEYECDFIASGNAVFKTQDITAVFEAFPPFKSDYTVTFWDIGLKNDATVGVTLAGNRESGHKELIRYERYEQMPAPAIANKIDERYREFPNGLHCVESNSQGDPIIQFCETDIQGKPTTGKNKPDMITALMLDIEGGKLHSKEFYPQLSSELMMYQWDDKNLTQDSVMALAGACYWANKSRPSITVDTGSYLEKQEQLSRIADGASGWQGILQRIKEAKG